MKKHNLKEIFMSRSDGGARMLSGGLKFFGAACALSGVYLISQGDALKGSVVMSNAVFILLVASKIAREGKELEELLELKKSNIKPSNRLS